MKNKSNAFAANVDTLNQHVELWQQRLADYGKGTYTPVSEQDFLSLAAPPASATLSG